MNRQMPQSRVRRAYQQMCLLEFGIMAMAVTIAARLRMLSDPTWRTFDFLLSSPVRTLLVAAAITAAMAAFGLYQAFSRYQRTELLLRLVLSFSFGGIALFVLYYLVPQSYIGRGVLSMALVIGFVGVVAARFAVRRIFGTQAFKRRVLVYGAGAQASLIDTRMRRASDRLSFVLVGYVPVAGQEVRVRESEVVRTDCSLEELANLLHVQEIVVALDERRGALPMDQMLTCAQRGVLVTDLASFFEREAGAIKLGVVDPSKLVFSGGFDHSLPRRLSKRFFDLAIASVLLAFAWPVMLLVALCVWIESGRPILYRQTRTGQGGRNFELIKFRSMRCDAEQDGVARWAQRNDDRTTRVGRFIRATRLDELPQLFNVLRGDMSFVGPRPERPQFVSQLAQEIRYYDVRHSVKPGLTGWAQLRYPYGASVNDAEEKLNFDLFYVKNQGLVFDLMIVLQTVEVVMFRRGAR